MKSLQEVADVLQERFSQAVLSRTEFRGETTLSIKREFLHPLAQYCRDELGFDYLVDIASVDHYGDEPRFEVVYELAILESWTHLRLKVSVSEEEPVLPSLVDLWPAANWHEREIFDMMGLRFENHPDLRRIIMWEGYPFHPLLKDFPLEGKPSEMPDVAFSDSAPLAGGPFVTSPTQGTTVVREPRAKRPGDLPPKNLSPEEP